MAGIYIHVPFCKQACNYCNFYFSTSSYFLDSYLAALIKEIEIQASYLNNAKLSSIYFGGGTPSILSSQALENILFQIYKSFKLHSKMEITLEGNPDDLNLDKLRNLKTIGINRLSIGTQSFLEKDLHFMKRAHNAKEAISSIENAGKLGFQDLSIDLIYGAPTQSLESWKDNLTLLQRLPVNHLSCYALTVEEGTPLFHQIKKGQVQNVDENLASFHFKELQSWATKNNWQHYEISNLCSESNFAVHNTSYWKGQSYLGLGPAAHSYNGKSRQWNISNIKKYIEGVQKGELNFEKEDLSEKDQFNEFIMTGIRTIWGVNKEVLRNQFPKYYPNFEKQITQLNPNWIQNSSDLLLLSDEGRFYADGIASDLFTEEY